MKRWLKIIICFLDNRNGLSYTLITVSYIDVLLVSLIVLLVNFIVSIQIVLFKCVFCAKCVVIFSLSTVSIFYFILCKKVCTFCSFSNAFFLTLTSLPYFLHFNILNFSP